MSQEQRVRVELEGVSETSLWTLFNRAEEARVSKRVIDDPLAVELIDRLDFPFAERFGKPHWAQAQALRARVFDDVIRDFAARHPGATVVALGEGLETQFWRVDDGRLSWVTVDLPPVVELRRRLLPESTRLTALSYSALGPQWLDGLGDGPVLVTAQGLFMYLDRGEVEALIARCAGKFSGGAMVFDAVPPWLSASTLRRREGRGYVAPPMLWGMESHETRRFAELPGVEGVQELPPPPRRGLLFGILMPLLHRIPALYRKRTPLFPWIIMRAEFG